MSEVLVERRGAALVMMLNRPAQRNAVTRAVSLAMVAALDELDADPTLRVGIVTGAGGHFCSGMDLKAFVAGERPEIEGRGFAGVTEASPAKPLIAAVEGYALAGGCELALACDLIVAGEGAVFGLPEAARGLVAGSGGLVRLRERIPPAIALEYAITARRMDAATAARWGLVNRLVSTGTALDAALALADEIAANAPLSVAASKTIMATAPDWPVADRWSRQRPIVEEVLASADAREGARAFAEKRLPVWSGR
ncbi:crotonase/enoyl-CoA hydratase family protein [Sphingomonas rubra]|uniref:Enoyl-CoA hydratase n=1 Tax=Sphingomonas rubra TaxID=634430 RepID=A0A1I5TNK6_9SPHN|nr:crotonase/enoyl-CoA hydratase family protein [Sphingomonas rubra]SFP84471.1 enoyl-CoA hydratase [Sphingomonas rubra]